MKETTISPDQARIRLGRLKCWKLAADAKSITCELTMKDFLAAVDLIQKIAPVAEQMDHHPDLHLTGFRKLLLELSTHSAGGLTDKDFELAVKIDALPKALK
jgi:4a-hydroxytetrahydrobiopterin dehydratase